MLKNIISNAKEDLLGYLLGEFPFYDIASVDDAIDEISDSSVPTYTSDILEVAMSCCSLATSTPADYIGLKITNTTTAEMLIGINIYERVRQELCDFYNEHEKNMKNDYEIIIELYNYNYNIDDINNIISSNKFPEKFIDECGFYTTENDIIQLEEEFENFKTFFANELL